MDLLGRDEQIEQLWRGLDRGSLQLAGPRRMGKTSILHAMHAKPRPGWRAVYVDLQGASSVSAFIGRWLEALPADVRAEVAARHVAVSAVHASLDIADGATQDAWNEATHLATTHLAWQDPDHRLVLLLDEVPWWLDELERSEAGAARAALANLRRLRGQLDGRLAMVLTGSVGLSSLAADLGASAELNDLRVMQLPPLEEVAGMALFERDVAAAGCTVARDAPVEAHRLAGGIPYWIEELAARCAAQRPGEMIDLQAVADAVDSLLSPIMRHYFQDEAAGHFLRRAPGQIAAIRAALDAAAQRDEVDEALLLSAVLMAAPQLRRGQAKDVILRLHDAWYLVPTSDDPSPRWRWLNPVMRRWWLRYGEAAL